MTGRELAAALRPLETWADAIQRFKRIADEAVKLESKLTGLELAQTRLAETQAKVQAADATLATLTADAATLAARLDEERRVAVAATEAEQAMLIAQARDELARQAVAAEAWRAARARDVADHETRMVAWKAEESALQEHLEGLRDMARRMAQAAAAAVR